MRAIGSILLFFCASAFFPGGAHSAPDEKGRDLESIARMDSLERARAIVQERENLLYRKRFLQAMRLDEFGQDCVAFDPAAGACLLTVEGFNRLAMDWNVPPPAAPGEAPGRDAVDGARRRLLSDFLRERFPLHRAMESGAGDSVESILRDRSREKWERKRREIGDGKLRALYRAHHERLFRGREERMFHASGSSDSVQADSLWRILAEAGGDSARRPSAGRPVPRQTLSSGDLTPALRTAAAGLRVGELSRPLKTPFGFVILRLKSVRRIPEAGYTDALPTLLALANRSVRGDLNVERALIEHYRANASDYLAPDTVTFRSWLIPGAGRLAGLKDTSGIQPRAVADWELPAQVRAYLGEASDFRTGDVVGPVKAVFGTWILKAVAVRGGGRPLTLEQARPRMMKRLFGTENPDPVEMALVLVQSKEDDLRKHLASTLLERRAYPSDPELKDLLRSPKGDSLLASLPAELPAPERERRAMADLGRAEAMQRLARNRDQWIRNGLTLQFIEMDAGTLH